MHATRQRVPVGLGGMPPGAELGCVLAGIDASRLSGEDAVTVLRAWERQLAHVQDGCLDAMVEVGLLAPGPDDAPHRLTSLPPYASDEVRAALVCSRGVAERRMAEGASLRWNYPELRAALRDGQADLVRVQVCLRECSGFPVEVARAALAEVLPEARELTPGELGSRLAALLSSLDPDTAEERLEAGVAQRRLAAWRNRDGTADLCGEHLPVERVAAATGRIDRVVVAAKAAGHPGMLRTLRADVFSGLLDGRWEGWSDDAIVEGLLLVADDYPDRTDGGANDPARGPDGAPTGDDAPGDDAPGDDAPGDDAAGDDAADDERDPAARTTGDTEAPGSGPDDHEPAESSPDAGDDLPGFGDDLPDLGEGPPDLGEGPPDLGEGPPGPGDDPPDASEDPPDSGGGPPGPDGPIPRPPTGPGGRRRSRRPRTELRVRLTTLLGVDRAPGELASAGLGTQAIPCALARCLAEQYRVGSWRLVLTDARGHLVRATVLRTRPCGSVGPVAVADGLPGRSPSAAATVVEVQVPLAVLGGLEPAAFPGWERVLARAHDLAARPAARSGAQPRRRHPDADLEQRIRARDRTCVFPGCRAPALLAEVDHTRDWAWRGDTVEINLGMLCRPDHCLKHGGRWRLRQTEPGRFTWTGPSGHTYERRVEPVLRDLPGPLDPDRVRAPYESVGDDDDEFEPVLPPLPPEPGPPRPRGPGLPELIRQTGIQRRAGIPVDGTGIPF